jgi:histidinol-phosphate aminotransferase/imidazoleglycerol-phosphate dehydratase/histidinol-phosphatase
MDTLKDIFRPEILALQAYSASWREGTDRATHRYLDANENPYLALGDRTGLNVYGEPQDSVLRSAVAGLHGVEAENVLLTAGSDSAIDAIVRAVCRAGVDAVTICPPTFGMYAQYAAVQGAGVLRVPLVGEDFALDVAGVLATDPKVVFIPAPNAPLGHAMDREAVLDVVRGMQGRALVVVDEAYADFTDVPAGFVQDLADFENLVVLRTFSKSRSLAGGRVGYALAHPFVIDQLVKVCPPYAMGTGAVLAAREAISAVGLAAARRSIDRLKENRERLRLGLEGLVGVRRVHPSQGNFVFVEFEDCLKAEESLRRSGILVRPFDDPRGLRITVGTVEDVDLVLSALGGTQAEARRSERVGEAVRRTGETEIRVWVDLDQASGGEVISTGIGFFDHMLDQIRRHGGFALAVECRGDLEIDAHHSVEDSAIALGSALRQALGDKRGVERFAAPLDEALAEVVLDLSGRAHCTFSAKFDQADRILGVGTGVPISVDLVEHFFRSLCDAMGATLHLSLKGSTNSHHLVEAGFKAFGRALRLAIRRSGDGIPSTKGVL